MAQRPEHTFTNLLVVMTDRHIGNLLVSLYAIQSAHQQLASHQTLCCVIDSNLLSLANYLLPEVEFIPCTLRGRKPSVIKKLSMFASMIYRLRRKNIDTAVDLYGHGESYRIAKLSGASYIAAFSCTTKLKPKYDWAETSTELKPQHQIDFYRYPFAPLFGLLNTAELNAPQHSHIIKTITKKIQALGINPEKPLVIIHPGAGKAYKLWPTHHWQQLIKQLEEDGKQVLLIGAGVDKEQVDAIVMDSRIAPVNGYQQFNLIETIHLGFVAYCMVGNDSGPTHLMATTTTNVISLFGPTDDTLWSPLSANSQILRSGTGCLPECSKQRCQRETSCLQALKPEQVFAKIQSMGR